MSTKYGVQQNTREGTKQTAGERQRRQVKVKQDGEESMLCGK